MRLLDRIVAALGGLLMVCIVVWVGAGLVRPALPLIVILFGLLLIARGIWRR